MLNNIMHWLLPNHCVFCDQTATPNLALCDDCPLDLPYLSKNPQCPQCGITLQGSSSVCDDCLFSPPSFSRAYIPFSYQAPISTGITDFKYRTQLTTGRVLADLLAQHIQAHQEDADWQTPDLIIPAPMHWERRWFRGQNHTEMIALYLSRALHLPVHTDWLKRHTSNGLQKTLNRKNRQTHLSGAFYLTQKSKIKGKVIALVDDVVTTTATAREISLTLKKGGATDIQLWAIARTPPPQKGK